MIKRIIFGLLLILTTNNTFGQEWNEEYGTPVIVLIETNPWLMVIGSDVPTIAIYESGNIIYKKIHKKGIDYYSVKIDSKEIKELIFNLGITTDLKKMDDNIQASNWTDQPNNILILNINEPKTIQVYGDLKNKETRKNTPETFLTVYDNLIEYKNRKAKEWFPDKIEILLTDYSHSPENPIEWPENWPNLENETTIKRSEFLYSLYLPKEHFDEFIKLISNLKEKQAIELNGKKFSVSYRFPFPNMN